MSVKKKKKREIHPRHLSSSFDNCYYLVTINCYWKMKNGARTKKPTWDSLTLRVYLCVFVLVSPTQASVFGKTFVWRWKLKEWWRVQEIQRNSPTSEPWKESQIQLLLSLIMIIRKLIEWLETILLHFRVLPPSSVPLDSRVEKEKMCLLVIDSHQLCEDLIILNEYLSRFCSLHLPLLENKQNWFLCVPFDGFITHAYTMHKAS